MPDKTSSESESAKDGKGGKGKFAIAGVLCLALVAAGYFLGGRLGGGAEEATAADEEEVEEPPITTIHEIVDLEPVNVNLADGHYLRVAISLGLGEVESEGGGGHGAEEGPSIETAPAADLVLTTLSGRQMDDLSSAAGREAARHDLEEGLVAYYGEEIVTVLFREFVMQ